jgi:hypothetical protein
MPATSTMLTVSLILVGLAALGGLLLLALYQWMKPAGRVWLPGAVHGLVGLAGFFFLLPVLGGPPRGVASGAGQFGAIAACLLGAGLLLGGWVVVARFRRRQPSTMVLGLHATLAVAGLVMLAAYASAS